MRFWTSLETCQYARNIWIVNSLEKKGLEHKSSGMLVIIKLAEKCIFVWESKVGNRLSVCKELRSQSIQGKY